MKLLLHQCCGPCSVFPIDVIKNSGFEVFGFFYNPNVHPIAEFYKRLCCTKQVNDFYKIKNILNEEYNLQRFVRDTAFRESNRCNYCYSLRIEKTVKVARKGKFDAFTTTLLYSKFQNHELIKEICESVAKKYKIKFFYHDFREGWKNGIEISKDLNLYRQQYCGCIFSEGERFGKELSKEFNRKISHTSQAWIRI